MQSDKLQKRFDELQEKYSDDNTSRLLGRRLVRAVIWDKSGGRCWYCGILTNPFSEFSIDHLIPQAKEGSDSLDNLVPCCRWCNSSKSHSNLESFRKNLAIRVSEIPLFSEEQIEYLQTKGVKTNLLTPNKFKFWFEKQKGSK